MAQNYSERLITENTAIRESFPFYTHVGPHEFTNHTIFDIQPSGIGIDALKNSIPTTNSFARLTIPPQVLIANTQTTLLLAGATIDTSGWKGPLPGIAGNEVIMPKSGIYFIHYMTTPVNTMSVNSEYYTEVLFGPAGNVTTIGSTSQIGRTAGSPGITANSKTFMRRFNVGERILFRVWQSEPNTLNFAVNITHLEV